MEALQSAAASLLDVKKAVDRAEQEIRTLKAQLAAKGREGDGEGELEADDGADADADAEADVEADADADADMDADGDRETQREDSSAPRQGSDVVMRDSEEPSGSSGLSGMHGVVEKRMVCSLCDSLIVTLI
jgi:hypothetical protein